MLVAARCRGKSCLIILTVWVPLAERMLPNFVCFSLSFLSASASIQSIRLIIFFSSAFYSRSQLFFIGSTAISLLASYGFSFYLLLAMMLQSFCLYTEKTNYNDHVVAIFRISWKKIIPKRRPRGKSNNKKKQPIQRKFQLMAEYFQVVYIFAYGISNGIQFNNTKLGEPNEMESKL